MFTIVSHFYDIHKDQEFTERYLSLAKEFILLLPFPLVFYTNSEYLQKQVSLLRDVNCTIVMEPFETTQYYPYVEKIKKSQYKIHNLSPVKDTPEYIVTQYNKFYFVEKAITSNFYNTTHFLYCDFGINHIAKNPFDILNLKLNDTQITQMCINPFIEYLPDRESLKNFFQYIYHHTSGGLFSGHMDTMLTYCTLFSECINNIFIENWFQLDEAVMTIVQRENPHLFQFYYGDYDGIITNLFGPVNDLWLINHNLEKAKKYEHAEHIHNIQEFLKIGVQDLPES